MKQVEIAHESTVPQWNEVPKFHKKYQNLGSRFMQPEGARTPSLTPPNKPVLRKLMKSLAL
jgi:hypothetical protein